MRGRLLRVGVRIWERPAWMLVAGVAVCLPLLFVCASRLAVDVFLASLAVFVRLVMHRCLVEIAPPTPTVWTAPMGAARFKARTA